MLKAEVTPVKFGDNFSMPGLMDEEGEYYVAVPQLVEKDLVPPNRSGKQLEALLGKAFPSHQIVKLKTDINSKGVNAIPLEMFGTLVAELAFKGNVNAQIVMRVLVKESLHQLFCDAFGVKQTAEDRQKRLTARFNVKHDFRPLTDQLQRCGFKEPWEYGKFISAMQSRIGIANGGRDFADFETLNKLERCQTKLTAYMDCGLSPWEALEKI